jgi:hypothetical protein
MGFHLSLLRFHSSAAIFKQVKLNLVEQISSHRRLLEAVLSVVSAAPLCFFAEITGETTNG